MIRRFQLWRLRHANRQLTAQDSVLPGSPQIHVRMLIPSAAVLLACMASAAALGAAPERTIIEQHRDRSVYVHGRIAAVKLPITRGVTLWNPAAIACSPTGIIFAANFTGEIYSLIDSDGDGLEDTARLFADVRKDGLRCPTSLAFRGDELFVGTAQEVRVYRDSDGDGAADQSRTFFSGFPFSSHQFDWTFGLCFGPDGWLYLNLSTDSYNPAAAPDPQGWRGAILRISPDGTQAERFATGVRFAPGMAFDASGSLFFGDNHGGQNPTEELNLALPGRFYGQNPAKFHNPAPAQAPLVHLQYGVAPAGICFNPAENDFGGTAGDLFLACWGPDWLFNRGSIERIRLLRQPDGSYRAQEFPFAHEVPKVAGVAFSKSGDLYAALFGKESPHHFASKTPEGAIYRFIPAPWLEPGEALQSKFPLIKGDVAAGKKLFQERGCSGCHSMDGSQEMLGPDLAGLGEIYSRDEVLNLIRNPSESIKSGHETLQVATANGATLLGRMLGSSQDEIILVTAGNRQVHVPRAEIASETTLPTSLMPAGLLEGLAPAQINDLLAYLGVRNREPSWSKARLLKLESVLRSVLPQVSLKLKLASIAAAALLFATLLAKRLKRKARPPQSA